MGHGLFGGLCSVMNWPKSSQLSSTLVRPTTSPNVHLCRTKLTTHGDDRRAAYTVKFSKSAVSDKVPDERTVIAERPDFWLVTQCKTYQTKLRCRKPARSVQPFDQTPTHHGLLCDLSLLTDTGLPRATTNVHYDEIDHKVRRLTVQGGPKKRGHKLTTIILSNLNRFWDVFHWRAWPTHC